MKKFISSIPLNRLVVYLIIGSLTPLFLVGLYYTRKSNEWSAVSDQIMTVYMLSEQKTRAQSVNMMVRKKHNHADPFYLDNQLESMVFLKKEREALERLIQNPTFTGNEGAEKRYAFLIGNANRLHFCQGAARSAHGIQETSQTLTHSVEIDTHDLKELLTRIEGNRPGKPQLLVTDFKLKKKSHTNGNEVFELNLKLLKREFL